MSSIREVTSAIMFGEFSNVELDAIIDAVKFRRASITRQVKRAVTLGSQVKFYSRRQGREITGTVEKVAIKFVTVNTSAGRWKVPANMLETV